MTVEIIRSVRELEAIAAEWHALFLADPYASPFQSPQWLLPWAQHLLEGELLSVALRDTNGVLTALLPAYIYRQPDSGCRDLLLLGAGTSDYLGGVFRAQEDADTALRILLERPGWDRADLHQLRQDSLLAEACRGQGFALSESEPCAVAATDPSSRPAKIRLNVNRYRHRAATRGKLRMVMASDSAEAIVYLEVLIDLHTRRWHTRGEHGVLASSAIQAQHRAAVPVLGAAGLLRMAALYLDTAGESARPPIAILYGMLDPPRQQAEQPRRFYAYLVGIDPDFAALSPGTLLLGTLFEECAEEGVLLFDMLRGGEEYKRLWGARPEPTLALRVRHP